MTFYSITFVDNDTGAEGLGYGTFEGETPVHAMCRMLNELNPWRLMDAVTGYRLIGDDGTSAEFTIDDREPEMFLADADGNRVGGWGPKS